MPYFAQQGYTCYALSLRGHGSSQGKERLRWWRVADYVADVAQVASSLPAPPRTIEATARAYGTQAQIFPGMAHDMMLEPRWEPVAARILAWLARTLVPGA